MTLLKKIRSLFRKPSQFAPVTTITGKPVYDLDTYIALHLKETAETGQKFTPRYGNDFNAFFYQAQIARILKTEIIAMLYQDKKIHAFLEDDHWHEKNPLNFPGPFYTGKTDTLGTGYAEAPFNVLFDADACEYVFRQPRNFADLICVMDAAAMDVFGGYSCNGNQHWTYEKCKEWWRQKPEWIRQLQHPEMQKANAGKEQLYIEYLETTAETDLRKYCYFLEHQHYPTDENTKLPPL